MENVTECQCSIRFSSSVSGEATLLSRSTHSSDAFSNAYRGMRSDAIHSRTHWCQVNFSVLPSLGRQPRRSPSNSNQSLRGSMSGKISDVASIKVRNSMVGVLAGPPPSSAYTIFLNTFRSEKRVSSNLSSSEIKFVWKRLNCAAAGGVGMLMLTNP